MKPEQRWANKEIVVIGAGSSGTAAAHLLLDCGAKVTVTDLRPAEELPGTQELVARGATLACGGHPDSLWAGKHAAIISPGIDPETSTAEAARAHGVPVVAEIELATPFLDVPAIAITGSNGKSTVTSMAGSILEAGGMKPAVCGNIGVALSAAVRQRLQGTGLYDAYVVELSSFQCEAIDEFRPHLAAILNLTPGPPRPSRLLRPLRRCQAPAAEELHCRRLPRVQRRRRRDRAAARIDARSASAVLAAPDGCSAA